eukprot:TRINITY_DN3349_c0_g1_i2.p2 TRINITY_DN3349_c0_g1~~TRINITY_DN3349_c0_g1_i2.p2  ORF type:complete len:280 (-),score=54.33 TRINITY_DN3349_c0_g1_i2:555-1394(-)
MEDVPQDYSINGYADFDAGKQEEMDVYTQLLFDIFLPRIRSYFSNEWQVTNAATGIEIVSYWGRIIPDQVLENILDQLIVPKLYREVEQWAPRESTTLISSWLLPWLPLLTSKMTPLYPIIRQKVGTFLKVCHPAEAKNIIGPLYNTVFDQKTIDEMMVKRVVHKLMMLLRQFEINPRNQKTEAFMWVMEWHGLVPLHHFVTLLETEFFTKWLNVLHVWLSNNADYDEVTAWYLGWKNMFGRYDDIVKHDRIRAKFNLALEAMNQVVTGRIPSASLQNK